MKTNIIAELKDEQRKFNGEIRIRNISMQNNTMYAEWKIFNERNDIFAFVAKEYYLKEEFASNEYLFNLIIDDILKFRLKRHKHFNSVQIIE